MKLFTKLALVSAIAVSGQAMAMQSLDDSALSAATGQDGINIGLGISKISIDKLYIHDNDGLGGTAATTTAAGNSGAITITKGGVNAANTNSGLVIAANKSALLEGNAGFADHNFANISIDTDSGATASDGAYLNVAAKVSGLNIYVGKIGVAKSNKLQASGASRGVQATGDSTIINGLSLTTGITTANIQLGATPQGAMIKLNGSMTNGLSISDLGLVDNGGKGQITIGKITLTDAGDATKLTTNADVAVTPDGLKITAMTTGTDAYISNISLSGSGTQAAWVKGASIGDVEVGNMQVFHGDTGSDAGAVIMVSGH